MRQLLLGLLFSALALPSLATEWRVALGVYEQVAGQKSLNTGGLAAFNEALAREICRRAAARCTFSSHDFKGIFAGVAGGEYQLGFGNFLRTPEREQQVAFSAPIWRSSSRLIGTAQAAKRFLPPGGDELALETVKGARVITVGGSTQHRYLLAVAAARRLSVSETANLEEAKGRLLAGEADFLLAPALSGYAMITELPTGSLQFIGPATSDHGLGGSVHIALPKGDVVLQQSVNRAIAAIRADGTYPRIVRQFFPFSLD